MRVTPAYFEIELFDEGPGFGSAPPRSDGLRIGLAGSGRLMDELITENLAEGARVVARKYRIDRHKPAPSIWESVCAMSVMRGEVECGDAYLVEESGSGLLVAAVDGLGHGSSAAKAAASVIEYVRRHSDQAIDQLLTGADEAARPTRGAVALLARIDPKAGTLQYAGVGDVAGIVLPVGERLVSYSGCLGVKIPDIRSTQVAWEIGSVLALWTDGARIERVGELRDGELSRSAENLLLGGSSIRDDALLLAVRERDEQTGTGLRASRAGLNMR